MEKQGFQGGCRYVPDGKDTNPAEYYDDIPDGCKLSNGIGVVALLTLVCMTFALNRDADRKEETAQSSLVENQSFSKDKNII